MHKNNLLSNLLGFTNYFFDNNTTFITSLNMSGGQDVIHTKFPKKYFK